MAPLSGTLKLATVVTYPVKESLLCLINRWQSLVVTLWCIPLQVGVVQMPPTLSGLRSRLQSLLSDLRPTISPQLLACSTCRRTGKRRLRNLYMTPSC